MTDRELTQVEQDMEHLATAVLDRAGIPHWIGTRDDSHEQEAER